MSPGALQVLKRGAMCEGTVMWVEEGDLSSLTARTCLCLLLCRDVLCRAVAALQHKQKQAAVAAVRLNASTVSQDAALKGLVATAKGVRDPLKPTFLEPVARMGAGGLWATAGTGQQQPCSRHSHPVQQRMNPETTSPPSHHIP